MVKNKAFRKNVLKPFWKYKELISLEFSCPQFLKQTNKQTKKQRTNERTNQRTNQPTKQTNKRCA